MRIPTVAVYTLATLTAWELINQAGKTFNPTLPNGQKTGSNVAPKAGTHLNLTQLNLVKPISLPEQLVGQLGSFMSPPAFAAKSPSQQVKPSPAKSTASQPQNSSSQRQAVAAQSSSASAAISRRASFCDVTPGTSEDLTSDQVLLIQKYLSTQGFNPGTMDGIWGTQTQTAISEYQSARKLQVDGLVGPRTWNTLAAEMQAMALRSSVEAKSIPTQPSTQAQLPTGDRPQLPTQPNSSNTKKPSTPPQSTQLKSVSPSVRLAAGLAMALSVPIIGGVIWQLTRTLRKPEPMPAFNGLTSPRTQNKLLQFRPLAVKDELALQKHCQEIANILSRNSLSETVRPLDNSEQELRVQILINSEK